MVLATSGPAGVQANEFHCEAIELDVYLLVPRISDHLFNLEINSNVVLWTSAWELIGKAQIIPPDVSDVKLVLLREPEAKWCALVRVNPARIHIRRVGGWGLLETLDLKSP